jgi:hypothetical protein
MFTGETQIRIPSPTCRTLTRIGFQTLDFQIHWSESAFANPLTHETVGDQRALLGGQIGTIPTTACDAFPISKVLRESTTQIPPEAASAWCPKYHLGRLNSPTKDSNHKISA